MITGRPFRMAAFACAAAFAGAACGDTSGGDDTSAPAPAPAAVADTAPAATDAAPAEPAAGSGSGVAVPALLQFTAPLIGGGEIVGDELAGKPTAFWFWSPT